MSNKEQLFAEIIPSEEANLSGGMGSGAIADANVNVFGGDFNQAIALTDARSIQSPVANVNSAIGVAVGVGVDIVDLSNFKFT